MPMTRDEGPRSPARACFYCGAVRTRIAPTPSGFLHAGNRANFREVARIAEETGADIVLRIDDIDAARYRRAYAADIFATLTDMGLEWSHGPRDVADFEDNWSQRRKIAYYRDQLQQAVDLGLPVYACRCSRSTQRGPATGGCVGGCRTAGLPLFNPDTAVRIAVPDDTSVTVEGRAIDVSSTLGDAVIWRRDNVPAYHLVSVIEDRDLAITHIVRGDDLLESTAFQIHLAQGLRATSVAQATYLHHALILGDNGLKLSKSVLRHADPEETSA